MNKLVSTIVSSTIAAAVPTAYAGISGGGTASSAQPVELLLIGPVEAINARAGVVTILGQKVIYSAAGKLVVGDGVAVFGHTSANGSFVATSITDEGQYVAGATMVFLSGKVQKADPAVGRVAVGGLSVDLTAAMSNGVVAPVVGTEIRLKGIQPVAGGLVLANGISGGGTSSLGISGGGTLGISGGGTRNLGISGGGHSSLGISGGGTLGISGGGLGISGGGTLGISGGGTRNLGISGGGHSNLGISGGGTLGISGGGTLGISGGGILGISGGGTP